MRRTGLILLLTALTALSVSAAEPEGQRVIKRQVYTQPPVGVDEGKVRVIRRIYRKVDESAQPEPQPKEETQAIDPAKAWEPPAQTPKAVAPVEETKKYRYFVGAGFGFVQRERSIVIDSKNNGDTLDLGGRQVTADGTSYSVTQDESESAPELEMGFYGGTWDYFGGKMTLYQDFAELSAFAGMRFHRVKMGSFTPYLQGMAGIGYDGVDGALPDNLTLGLAAGVEKALSGDYLTLNLALSYQHRFWQKLEMEYGDEYWRDSEVGIRGGVRYAF